MGNLGLHLQGGEAVLPCYVYAAKVTRVIDADTFDCVVDLGFYVSIEARIRVKGFDAPELHTRKGEAARAYVICLLGKNDFRVTIATSKADPERSFARYVAEVYLPNGDSLARRCIRAGHGRGRGADG